MTKTVNNNYPMSMDNKDKIETPIVDEGLRFYGPIIIRLLQGGVPRKLSKELASKIGLTHE
jgi:hypothetical protein